MPRNFSPLLGVFREIAMGRKKLQMKKIENHAGRLIRYAKRRDGMVKKASELSILCDADVGLLMFSPTGRLTSFSSSGRIEDIFLRYIGYAEDLRGGPVENEENLIQRLVHLNFEHKMLDKIMKMKDLEEKLQELRQQNLMAREKMRSYNLNAHSIITSVRDARALEQTLFEAIQHVEQLKEILLNNAVAPQEHETTKVMDTNVKAADLYAEAAVNASKCRNSSRVEGGGSQTVSPLIGSHLSIDFLKGQRDWSLQSGGHASKA